MELLQAPWKVAAGNKRTRNEEEEEEKPATKIQKISAMEVMETDPVNQIWEDEDF